MKNNVDFAKAKCEKVKHRQNHDPNEFYRQGAFWKSQWNGRCQDIDMNQLLKGIAVEMEHTESNIVSTKIALDHIVEFKDYYDALDEMENKLKKKHRRKN